MMKVILYTTMLLLFFWGALAHAAYNSNVQVTITNVMIYTGGDYIYFTTDTKPQHPTCNNSYFVIPETVPENRRNQLLSRLMLAYTTKEQVNIGFDATGECVHGYIQVHRVG